MDSIFFKENLSFSFGGIHHLGAVLFFAFLGGVLIYWARKYLDKKEQNKLGNIMAFILSITIIVWTFLKIVLRGFDAQHDLPFHLCNFIALLLPVFSVTRKKVYYEILVFWIFAGTLQAVITPDLKHGFPHFHYIKYWITHAGLVVFIMYATLVYNLRPNLKSVFKSFLALQVYFVLTLVVNYLTGANYLYLNRKPEAASLLDYLGNWPWYILVAELILIPYFLLIYIPFYLSKKRSDKEYSPK